MRNMRTAERLFSLYLLPDFSLLALSSAIEVLRLANEVVGSTRYKWRIISGNGEPVSSSCGMRVTVDASLPYEREQLGKSAGPSMAVVCGGGTTPDAFKPLDTWLRECRNHRVALAGLASGTFILARAGLADGRRCAIHWEHFPSFSEEFPDIEAQQTTFEVDGDLHTSPGGDASFDMFLNYVEEDSARIVANRVCEKAMVDRVRDPGERQRLPLQARVGINHRALIRVIELMEANVAEPLTLAQMAPSSGLSRRQIERIFHQEMGRSPARYYLELRLERAHLLLLSSPLPVIDIAMACGFISASHFSKTYRETYGCSPQQARIAAAERRRVQHASSHAHSRPAVQALSAWAG
ncbi:probable transcriptional regulator protein, AraC family (plasmid) [Sinorhizobium fredii NGR234]|uniref:Probable transcriptional regulator protein, AraC family n=1 Tax=Sinorhizobium fredii (strain NBRC 101917 / NGR234) TaxID=394 RepID=Q6W212_SINFN|nr:GlxA family transcriptional regulator [Sinorhizobium fredii]AAQ87206.1 Transcriptional regulator, AraC family [Sinorhizobium fredii NGR234]ACP23115.1 probable transcriptional regulator protein, AraC family [Sinorhizobium fredii NGR234]